MARKIIIICGPTAAGKTRIGIELARKFAGEIVSADSQQVWRGFDIGTAKANLKERSDIPHHLIDVADPDEHFDAARYAKLADDVIVEISGRGKIPFVVGGTGMYLRMLVHGQCEAPPQDQKFREQIEMKIEDGGIQKMHELLAEVDPESASKISPNDRTRIVRALEIHHVTGRPASVFRKGHGFKERRYDALKIGISVDRAELYRRIDERVDRMMRDGLMDEVRSLLGRYPASCQPFLAVGYRELVASINGEIDFDEAIRLTKQNSRHFAKRQLTWFKADGEIRWFDAEDEARIVAAVADFIGN